MSLRSRKEKPLPTEADIVAAFKGTNFGPNPDFVQLVQNGLLYTVIGYHNGYTLSHILKSLGLVTIKPVFGGSTIKITELGRRAMTAWFAKKERSDVGSTAV